MQLTGNGDYPVVAGVLTVNPDAEANIVLRINSGSAKYSSPFVGIYPAEGMVDFMAFLQFTGKYFCGIHLYRWRE